MKRKLYVVNVLLALVLLLTVVGIAWAQGAVQEAADAYFSGGTKNMTAEDLFANLNDGDDENDPFIIDTRSADDYALGHITGAVNVSVKALFTEDELAKLPADSEVVVVCYTGQTSSQSTAALRMLGYDAWSLLHGMGSWAVVDGVTKTVFDPANTKGYAVETDASTATETYDLPDPLGDTVQEAADAYFSGGTKNMTAEDLFANLNDGDDENDPFIIDTRSADDYALGHIPGAVNVSVKTLFAEDELEMLPADGEVVVVCYTGQTSSQATAALRMLGYDAWSMLHGMGSWAVVEGVTKTVFDPATTKGYAVEVTAVEMMPETGSAGFPVAPLGLMGLGVVSISAGVAGVFVSRRRES